MLDPYMYGAEYYAKALKMIIKRTHGPLEGDGGLLWLDVLKIAEQALEGIWDDEAPHVAPWGIQEDEEDEEVSGD